jgi:TRAP-type uncharacterized transport system fused permease subunit
VTELRRQLAAITGSILPAWAFDAKGMTLFFTLVMTAIVCILLGCGVPTTANYIIMVTVAAPALALLGVEPIVAHFFVFYYGVLADITPPVALAAYAAASMAGPIRSRPATPPSASASPRRWCPSSSSTGPRCSSSPRASPGPTSS